MATDTLPTVDWQEPARRALDTYRDTTERMFDLIPSWEPFAPDDETREVARLAHQAARARASVVREWLISPLWVSGLASPSDLGEKVQTVIDTDRQLGEAWAGLMRAQGERFAGNARQILDVANDAVDRTERLSEKAADVARDSARSTADASKEAAVAATAIARDNVETLREIAPQDPGVATMDAASNIADTLRRVSDATREASVAVTPTPIRKASVSKAPAGRIKGNTTRDGEKIFHVPGQSSYEQLQTEDLFSTQVEAIEAGYRIARSSGGPSIKGNIGRDGSRIYHMPGQANYDRVEAEALFATEEEAVAEGFRAAQR